jgi:hypothetical protein
MKRIVACCLLVTAIAACQRICGDMQALTAGEAGAGGETGTAAGEGGASAGEGGTSTGEGGTSTGEGGAGGESGAPSGGACQMLTGPQIIDFNDTLSSSALGEIVSDAGDPIADTANKNYHENGSAPNQSGIGFRFKFSPCVDASGYDAISFNLSEQTPDGITVWVASTFDTGEKRPFGPNVDSTVVCVPLPADRTAISELRFEYDVPGTASGGKVDLLVDDVEFSTGACP